VIGASFVAIGSSVGTTLLFVAVVIWFVRNVQRRRADARAEIERDVLRGHAAKRFDEHASFLGLQSKGAGQMRGNGTLALTSDELAFVLWMPHQTIRIPLRDIVMVDTAKSHLGKSLATPLLRVRWTTAGIEEIVAWRVVDLSGWLTDLQSTSPTQPHA
jgi:hypothetical protein